MLRLVVIPSAISVLAVAAVTLLASNMILRIDGIEALAKDQQTLAIDNAELLPSILQDGRSYLTQVVLWTAAICWISTVMWFWTLHAKPLSGTIFAPERMRDWMAMAAIAVIGSAIFGGIYLFGVGQILTLLSAQTVVLVCVTGLALCLFAYLLATWLGTPSEARTAVPAGGLRPW